MNEITRYLNNAFDKHEDLISQWLDYEYSKLKGCLYSSVDIRNSGQKIVPIDTNLFPAGFNNFFGKDIDNAIVICKNYLNKSFPNLTKILIIAENHTRNLYYLDSLYNLKRIIEDSGYEVCLGVIGLDQSSEIISYSGYKLTINDVRIINNKLVISNKFVPELIISNNDMSSGIPIGLDHIEIPIIPELKHGWHTRSKSNHFTKYQILIDSFCKNFELDSFYFSSMFVKCGKVNFKEQKNIDCVATNTEKIINSLTKKYLEYAIKDQPYVFIKADRGTYGMGIMIARSGDDVIKMNKKIRNKMNSLKQGVENSEVIIQEGIRTIDQIDGKSAEPLIYCMDSKPFGITYRVNELKDQYSNLNSNGMFFTNFEDELSKKHYYLLARIATLAAAAE